MTGSTQRARQDGEDRFAARHNAGDRVARRVKSVDRDRVAFDYEVDHAQMQVDLALRGLSVSEPRSNNHHRTDSRQGSSNILSARTMTGSISMGAVGARRNEIHSLISQAQQAREGSREVRRQKQG